MKGLFYTVAFLALAVFGIHKGWHNNIAEFGKSAKPYADNAVEKVAKTLETSKDAAEATKEATNKVATDVKNATE